MEDFINTLDTSKIKFTKIKLYLGNRQSPKHFEKNINTDFYKQFLDKITLEKSSQFERNNTYIYENLIYNINSSECFKINNIETIMKDKFLIYFIDKKKYDTIKFPCKKNYNQIKTKYFCIINADGSMDPKEIKYMMNLTNKNSFIFGSRYLKNAGSDDDTIITYLGNKIFSLIGNIFFKLKISDILYTYIIGDTKFTKSLNLKSEDFRICVELPIKVHRKGYNYTDYGCYELKRIGGKKKVNAFKDGFAFRILTKYL